MRTSIQVHPRTHDPEGVWYDFSTREGRVSRTKGTIHSQTPVHSDKIRFVCISDTHNKLSRVNVPKGDVLLVAGDLTGGGRLEEIDQFNREIGQLSHKHKIVIAGNHEFGLDESLPLSSRPQQLEELRKKYGKQKVHELLTNCTYLQDSEVTVYGYRIYGAPWICDPERNRGNPTAWAFGLRRGQELLDKWDKIPSDIDILMTHTPPLGHGDYSCWRYRSGELCGCVELLNTVEKRVKPIYHVFGHVHERYGATTNGSTTFINASICDWRYSPWHQPIVFDLPIKDGVKK